MVEKSQGEENRKEYVYLCPGKTEIQAQMRIS